MRNERQEEQRKGTSRRKKIQMGVIDIILIIV